MKRDPSIQVLINREVRRVPLDWQHPRQESGEYIPLLPRRYYEEGDDGDYMPDFSRVLAEQLGICVYETTTEGTPRSPVFPDTPEGRWALVHYCANKVSVFAGRQLNAEAWAELLFRDQAVFDLTHDRILFDLTKSKAA